MRKRGAENRRSERKRCIVPVEAKQGTPFEHTMTIDVSARGIGFVSEQEVSVNDQIAVELELSPDGDFVVKIGKVKWVQKIPEEECYRFGMELGEAKAVQGEKSLS